VKLNSDLKRAPHWRVLAAFSGRPVSSIALMSIVVAGIYADVLFLGAKSVTHDGFKAFPFFHYFIQNIENGIFPLWSPFTHAGEPFWTYIQIIGLTSPLVSAFALVGMLFPNLEPVSLYHWYIFLAIVVFNSGVALVANSLFSRLGQPRLHWISTPLIFLGSISLFAWDQPFGTIFLALWFPWIIWFLLQSLESVLRGDRVRVVRDAFLAGTCLAFQLCSFNPAFLGIGLFVYGAAGFFWALVCRRDIMQRLFRRKELALLFGAAFVIPALLFAAPMIKFVQYQDQFFPIARAESAQYYNQKVTYQNSWVPVVEKYIRDIGTSATINDFFLFTQKRDHPRYSEVPIALGPFGLLMAYLGLLCFRNRYYLMLAPPVVILALLSLGEKIGLSTMLHNTSYIFSFIRHFEFFTAYIFFGAALLMCVGISAIASATSLRFPRFLRALLGLGVISSAVPVINNVPHNLQETPAAMKLELGYQGNIYSDFRSWKIDPIKPLAEFKDDYISQGEPLLLYRDTARFFDNATQFVIPAAYWTFLTDSEKYGNIVSRNNLLGISAPKLRIIGGENTPQEDVSGQELGRMNVIRYNANELEIQVDIIEDGRLFYSMNRFPGWMVSINGQVIEVPDHEGHPFFEFPIEKGLHLVKFSYRPRDIQIAYLFHYLGQALFLLVILSRVRFSVFSRRTKLV
jgi:hypothetical protein